MGNDIDRLVTENFPRIATDLLTPLLELYRLGRELCGGDADKFLLVLALAIRAARHQQFLRRAPEELYSGDLAIFPGFGTYAQTVAQQLDMPRETVRRKVMELLNAGWLVREDGRLYVTTVCHQEMEPVRRQIEQLAVVYHGVVEGLRAG